jgi:hypothetical protein
MGVMGIAALHPSYVGWIGAGTRKGREMIMAKARRWGFMLGFIAFSPIYALSAILVLSSLSGCSTNAPEHLNMQAKLATPPKDKALIYIFRPYIKKGMLRSPDFSINGNKIGELENERFGYFFAYPMELAFDTPDKNGVIFPRKYKFEAGRAYYFMYIIRGGFTQLSQDEGIKYLHELNLSDKFKPVVVGTAPVSSQKTTDIPLQATDDYLRYTDNTKFGVIKSRYEVGQRDIVLKKIEDICNTKNVALIAGETMKNNASYKTLDEVIESNSIEIEFQCLY